MNYPLAMLQAARELRKLATMEQDKQCFPGFTKWLYRHRDQDDWLGDVARDAYNDPNWPEEALAYGEYQKYLQSMDACSTFMHAFNRAWSLFTGRPITS